MSKKLEELVKYVKRMDEYTLSLHDRISQLEEERETLLGDYIDLKRSVDGIKTTLSNIKSDIEENEQWVSSDAHWNID